MNDMYIAYSWMAVSLAGFAGFWLHLHYRRRDRSLNRGADLDRLEALVEELQAEMSNVSGELHDRLEDIHERLDFTERLLSDRPAGGPAIREKSEQSTPV